MRTEDKRGSTVVVVVRRHGGTIQKFWGGVLLFGHQKDCENCWRKFQVCIRNFCLKVGEDVLSVYHLEEEKLLHKP